MYIQIDSQLAREVNEIACNSRIFGKAEKVPVKGLVGLSSNGFIAHHHIVGTKRVRGFN